jgi:hypothetical protein
MKQGWNDDGKMHEGDCKKDEKRIEGGWKENGNRNGSRMEGGWKKYRASMEG